jgi:hypothetical protein
MACSDCLAAYDFGAVCLVCGGELVSGSLAVPRLATPQARRFVAELTPWALTVISLAGLSLVFAGLVF